MSVPAHAQAYLTLLAASGLTVHDGKVPDTARPPYVIAYFAVGAPSADTYPGLADLSFDSTVMQARAYVHAVGASAQAAREVANRAQVTLLNVTPSVLGRSCMPIEWEYGQPPQRDEITGVLVMDQVDVYWFLSVPG